MKLGTGKILEIRQTNNGSHQAKIRLADISLPGPGQYLQVHHASDESHAAGFSLYPGGLPDKDQETDSFITASPIPLQWAPGDLLQVRGPLGKGFHVPENVKRLALITFSELSDHLLPLAAAMLANKGEVAMFIKSDPSSLPPTLPARIEINKLDHLRDGLKWADFAAFSVGLEEFPFASEFLTRHSPLGVQGQIMVFGQTPCAGLADCGICSVRMPKGRRKLTCKDGPVLDYR